MGAAGPGDARPGNRPLPLDPAQLQRTRIAFAIARNHLVEPGCLAGHPPPRVHIIDREPRTLLVTGPGGTYTPPSADCWSANAERLYRDVNDIFGPIARPYRGAVPAPLGAISRDSIVASVGLSEWGPPGSVSLDLDDGSYWLTPAPYTPLWRGRSGAEVVEGRLDPARLSQVRAAYRSAQAAGLVDPECRDGADPTRIVLSNAVGPIVLLLAGPDGTSAPPERRACWSDGAERLERVIRDSFDPLARPVRRAR
jgi:hypothetical protein